MDPFDEGYWARREKQIQDLYNMRAATWACLLLAVLLTLGSVPLLLFGSSLAIFAVFFAGCFWLAGIFMAFFGAAQKAADKAIQKEHERLMELYERTGVKRKRDEEPPPVRLADDGEIEAEMEAEESPHPRPLSRKR